MKNNNTLTYRVGQLESSVKDVDDKMDTLLTNHLPHLEQKVENNKTTIKIATAINIGAILLAAAFLKYL